ncbi:MAG: hypothetical protein CL679_13880 [Bermanella sp.]|nr:hypothetical protein [Bermanella sp.]|tara:strand:- start:2700 stop:3590 length:891 start_codon:yes stop_codon:yes gene_type:complete
MKFYLGMLVGWWSVCSWSVSEWDYEIDPYYSNIAYYQTLDDSPVPELGERSEAQVYSDLFFSSYLPRFFLLEASLNPMPILGVALKSDDAQNLYEDMTVTQKLNLVEVATAGFEEPYAVSVFLGNMIKYRTKGNGEGGAQSKGFMGYLASYGHLHIRKNELVQDRWGEFEWKIKGDKVTAERLLSWSFRVGTKIHDNPYVTDEYYVAIKRERVEERGDIFSWIKNGGIEFKYRVSQRSGKTIGQQIIIDKKIPLADRGWIFSFGVGLVRETREKYSGPLSLDESSTAFVLRPSMTF